MSLSNLLVRWYSILYIQLVASIKWGRVEARDGLSFAQYAY
jgi:hypothetical protein